MHETSMSQSILRAVLTELESDERPVSVFFDGSSSHGKAAPTPFGLRTRRDAS